MTIFGINAENKIKQKEKQVPYLSYSQRLFLLWIETYNIRNPYWWTSI